MSPPNSENDEIVVKSEPSDDVQEYYFANNSRSHGGNSNQMSESQSKERIMEYNKKVLADAINKIIKENEKCLKDLGLLPETPESEVVQDKKNDDEQPPNTAVTNSKSNEQSESKSADTTCRSKEKMMKYNSEILAETINKVIMENEKCLRSLGLLRDDEQTSGISSGAEREDERKKEEDTHKSSVNEDFNTPIERSRQLLKNAIQDVISEGESGAQETTALTDKHERSPDDFQTLDLSMRKSSKSRNEFASTSQFQKIVNNPSQRACSSENIHSACALPHTGNTRGYHVRHGKRIFPRFNGSRDQQQPCNSKYLETYCEPTLNKHFKSKRNNLHNCKPVDLSLDEKVDKNTEVQSLNPDKMEESVACFHDKDDDTKKVTSPNSSTETMKMPIDTCDDLNSDSPFDSSDEAMIENAFAEFAQKNSELDDIVALIDPMLVSGRSSQETSSSVLDNTFKNLFDFINEDTRDAGNWHDDVNRTSPDLLCSEKMKDSPDKDTSHSGECIDVSDDENNPMATQNICTQTSPEFVKPSSLKSPVTPKIKSVFSITKEGNRFTAAKSSLDLEETSSSSLQQVNVVGISPSEKVGKVTKLTMQYIPEANCIAKKKTKRKKSSKSKGNKVNENQSRYISINRPPYQQCLNTPRHTHTSYRYVPPYQWKVRIGAAPQPEVAKSPIYVTPMYVANTHQRHQVHAPLPNPTGSRFYTIGNSVHVGTSELQPTRFVVPNNRNDVRYRIRGANVFRFPTS
uniref:uncharacterized protein LOC120338789 n=1 Tax=Styela clava TaxID=7725 RepID=UPI0019392A7A|nr:uncharacterized protein LOC120338789 [Styela clava]